MLESITQNPFYILGLTPEASRMEIERQRQLILGMMAGELRGAFHYSTPLGVFIRTPDSVRWAMAELQNPDRRLLHEIWACLPAVSEEGEDSSTATAQVEWPELRLQIGW